MASMNPEREERRKGVYSHERSKKMRERDESEHVDREEGGKGEGRDSKGGSKERDPNEKSVAEGESRETGMLSRHASEREALRVVHEAERRDEHNHQRGEHRSMNARHEEEHEGLG